MRCHLRVLVLALLAACSNRVTPTPPSGCGEGPACEAGNVCIAGECRKLCQIDSDCGTGNVCVRETCEQSPDFPEPPVITSVNSNGAPDGESGHAANHLGDKLVVVGQNLASATATLSIGTAETALEVCSSSNSQLVLAIPADLQIGVYTLTVANQAGQCSATATILKGEPGQPGMNGERGPPGPASGGLVLQLELDETTGLTFADSSTYGNDAVGTGAVTAAGFGHSGVGVAFSGGYLTVAAGNTIPDSPQAWVEAWIRPSNSVSGTRVLAEKVGAWELATVDGKPRFSVEAATGACAVVHPSAVISSVATYQHVSGWYNGLVVAVTLDGHEYRAACTRGPIVATEGDVLHVGGTGVMAEAFEGYMDELRVRATAPSAEGRPSTGFPGSALLTGRMQQKLVEWTGQTSDWTLCYSTAQHALTSAEFHTRCNYRGPSVTVMRSSTGRVLGGYIENSWHSGAAYTGYDRAFMFTFTPNGQPGAKRYGVSAVANTMYGHASYGPAFGNGHDIVIRDGMLDGYCNFPQGYSCNGSASPNNACAQELCGVNACNTMGCFTISALEVWIPADY